MKYHKLLAFAFALISISGFGQNIHFTLVDFAPQSHNPAFNGAFSGSYRGSAIVRSQYDDANGFKTVEINIDAPIIRGFRAQDWIGAGISFDKDVAGSLKFGQTFSRIGLTYHLSLDKKQKNIFSLGIQYVNINSTLNKFEKDAYNSGILNGAADQAFTDLFAQSGGTSTNTPQVSKASNNWVLGTTFTQNNKTGKLVAGIAVSGIIAGDANFKDSKYKHPFNLSGIIQYKGIMNKKVLFEPTLFFQTIPSEASELMANATVGYKLSKESDWIIKGGIGFRTGSLSPQALAGIEKGGLRVGLSLDVPINGFSGAYGFQNAFELAVSYTGLFQKVPKPKPTIICPRL